jgi:hypothetical protein
MRTPPVTSAIASSVERSSPPSPHASPTPTTRPARDATAPRIDASSRTQRRSWARLAPTQRSSASSRVRAARTTEKVLRIRNMPAKSATTPAAKKNWLSPPSVGVALRARSAASAVSVKAWKPGPRAAATRSRSSCSPTPATPSTSR